MLATISIQQAVFFAILGIAFLLFLTDWIRNDLVAVLIVLALYLAGILDSREALSGFSSEPALVVAAIFVLGGALNQTGVSEVIGRWVGRAARGGYAHLLLVLMPAVAVFSAFTHHVTMTAVMIPVALQLARERDLPPSKLLMPVAFAASLGTTITIIGAPAFLIADGALRRAGRPGLGVFSIAPIGLALTAAGTAFMVLVGRYLLPSRKGEEDAADRFRLGEYLTEVVVRPGSPLVSRTGAEVEADPRHRFRIVGWIRRGHPVPPPFGVLKVEAGDILIARASPEDISSIREDPTVELHPIEKYGARSDPEDPAGTLVQAVVSPSADVVGSTIGEANFHRRFGVIVVGLWRRAGWVHQRLSRIRLRPGDVLVLLGDEEALRRVAAGGHFLLMPFPAEVRLMRKAPLAAAIMVATILVASLGVVSLEMAALAGAAAMVLARCITPGQAYRSIDARIFVFIAGAIPLGMAMEKCGASTLLAGWLQAVVGAWSPTLVLFLCFAIVGVLTQFMSDSATTALFAPVAIALARALGQPPEPFVVTVAMASIASFLTPIGHHGNLLVYGPGGYRFSDFARVGTPLTVVVAVVAVLLAAALWMR